MDANKDNDQKSKTGFLYRMTSGDFALVVDGASQLTACVLGGSITYGLGKLADHLREKRAESVAETHKPQSTNQPQHVNHISSFASVLIGVTIFGQAIKLAREAKAVKKWYRNAGEMIYKTLHSNKNNKIKPKFEMN